MRLEWEAQTCPASNREVGHHPACFLPSHCLRKTPSPGPTSSGLGLLPNLPADFPEGAILEKCPSLQLYPQAIGIGHCDLIEVAQHTETSPTGPVPLQGSGTPRVTRGACSDVTHADWQEGLAPWGFHVNTPDLNSWGGCPIRGSAGRALGMGRTGRSPCQRGWRCWGRRRPK